MSILIFNITTPVQNALVGRTVAVAGRARSGGVLELPAYRVEEVRVSFDGGGEQAAELALGSWTCTVSALPTHLPGTVLPITATARGMMTPDVGEPGDPQPGDPEPFESQITLDVKLDNSVPETLTIDSFESPVSTQPGQPYVFDLSGTAGDALMGISAVQLGIDGGPLVNVTQVVQTGGGQCRWKQIDVQVPAGVHTFTVRAVDSVGNHRDATAEITVQLPFEPGPVEQVFQPTRYLLDLGTFARRYLLVAGSTDEVTPAVLAARFHQPFDRLTVGSFYEQATAPVPQARIAVEVLRARLGAPAPTALDQRYRGLAYQTFLRAMGTSYDEMRLALTADEPTRRALARRLGIGVGTARPDRLDELTLSPETIADTQLEALCGYRSTAPGDPLRPTVDAAKVLLWRRDALRTQWESEDEAQRDSAAGSRPLIDPDVLPEGHLRTREPEDAAYALWTTRRQWITDTLADIERVAQTRPDPLPRLDHVVRTFVGIIDLPALAALDADGANIGSDLASLELDLDAFRFLARSRALLADGVLLDTEWRDIFSILLQVSKRRRYREWRLEERRASLVLAPASFVLDGASAAPPTEATRWRFRRFEYLGWRATLAARVNAAAAVESSHQRTVEATESAVLPELRDALIGVLAAAQPQTSPEAMTERLGRELMIDLRADSVQRTTRVDQALETLQATLFSARAGRLLPDGAGRDWTIGREPTGEREFDREWDWMGSFRTWRSAVRVFAYPENQLLPALFVDGAGLGTPTAAYGDLIKALREESRLTPEKARAIAADYLESLRGESGVPLEDGIRDNAFVLTDERSNDEIVGLQTLSRSIHDAARTHQREIFWLVPIALAGKLQQAGQFQAALDWYQTVYAYHLPAGKRRIYHGLEVEKDIQSTYVRGPKWLLLELNPHFIARTRKNCYTRATIMAIVGCFNAYADAEFARSTSDANALARTLYETGADLLDLPEAQPETGPDVPFPANPVADSLRQHVRSSLAKIHRGLNIAGVSILSSGSGSAYETSLPSQYRYSVLAERAKNFVAIAQQVEAAYLSALEQRDAKTYDALRAGHDLQVAGAARAIQVTKLGQAVTGQRLAGLQRQRAQLQYDHYDEQIREGLSGWEKAGLGAMGAAAYLQIAAGVVFATGAAGDTLKAAFSFGIWGDPDSKTGQALSAFAGATSTLGQIAQTKASYDRREQEWQLQRSLAGQDVAIADQQAVLAQSQLTLAMQEHALAVLQIDHAEAVAVFLATKFTNAELYEWMAGVLGRVYAFFLQQATALARLAEAQLAFERQELPVGFVSADYWRDDTAGATAPDRKGLTGSARLLQDVNRLDQYAFDTDRRKLHVSQTFPLSQIAAFELQQFRQTGVLTFATPELLFDREFPGHYLRLIKQVRVSLIALLPPVRGVRATLTCAGVSRTVVARGPFDTVTLRRDPESISFTSPTNATGLFDLVPENGLLRPFEGMGVETVWQLELPKAANPFDYRSIADVLLTIDYTALSSEELRQRVVHELDRRFTGDRSFSVRNQFPDAWYELNNPDSVEPDRRMRVELPLEASDFPPHIEDLRVDQVSLFVMRKDALADELTITSVEHEAGGETVTAAEVSTVEGIVTTRRPAGAAWRVLTGLDPAAKWELRLLDDPVVRSWFSDGLIEDLVFVLTVAGTTPAWP